MIFLLIEHESYSLDNYCSSDISNFHSYCETYYIPYFFLVNDKNFKSHHYLHCCCVRRNWKSFERDRLIQSHYKFAFEYFMSPIFSIILIKHNGIFIICTNKRKTYLDGCKYSTYPKD